MANIQFNNIKEIGLPIGAIPIGIDGLTEDLIAENGGIIMQYKSAGMAPK
jgi:hypothetical protein